MAEVSKTPITSKQGYNYFVESEFFEENELDYSETSKKKPQQALGRKDSRAYDKSISNQYTLNEKPKLKAKRDGTKGLNAAYKGLDDRSNVNLLVDDTPNRQADVPDLKLKISQIKTVNSYLYDELKEAKPLKNQKKQL